ncbi:MAG TPA: bifunctional cytidylyltransferase/SDR family oxidoreductase [Lacunisphaera sp.]|nr:bifunctional cytidylyltransferase/SDR family oxidoreductase [Lacunisphaera sp.]
MKIKHIAVILAGGTGQRAGFGIPKQFTKLAGRPLVAHTLEVFQSHKLIDEIAVVSNTDGIHLVEEIVTQFGFDKVKKILSGGAERYQSSLSAIYAYEKEAAACDLKLIFHDAVRPLVNKRIIDNVVQALEHYNAVDVVIPASDTVVEANMATNTIKEIPERSKMRLGQTPQGFAYQTIKLAYTRAIADVGMKTTDDCGVVVKYVPEERVALVDGNSANMKLTHGSDLLLLDKLLQCSASRRMEAAGDDVLLSKLRNKVIVIFGGASGIGKAMAELARAYDAKVAIASRGGGIDVRSAVAVSGFLKETVGWAKEIHAVVNTAAVLHKQALVHMSDDQLEESIQTNVMGAFVVARCAHEYLEKSHGHLLMFASSSYTYGRAFYAPYSASKAAVVNLTQALSDEWSRAGIKVNCINPERTRTPLRAAAFGVEAEDSLLQPEFVGRRALHVLVGDMTGHVFDVSKP